MAGPPRHGADAVVGRRRIRSEVSSVIYKDNGFLYKQNGFLYPKT